MNEGPILSDAHEWMQQLPLAEKKLVCVRCGVAAPMRESPLGGCSTHWEHPRSGYSDMRHPSMNTPHHTGSN